MEMKSCLVKLCMFLFLMVEGTRGSEITINVRTNASVTVTCSNTETLGKCYCPSYPRNCHNCINPIKMESQPIIYNAEKYFTLSGLKNSDSGLYACIGSSRYYFGQQYRLNVFEEQNSTVIGAVGESIILSCGTELDTGAASEKHWCRSSNGTVCQPDTVMGREKDTRGDFVIREGHGSFYLEKRQMTLNDTGFYRCTQISHNQTKVHVVKLQVQDVAKYLQITPLRVHPKPHEHFEIICQYSQELQEFSKSWLCGNSECPETVKSVDDRFQSALILSLDHVACSKLEHFQCVAKTSGSSPVKSQIYRRPLAPNPLVDVDIVHYQRDKKVQVNAYSLLSLRCVKRDRYYLSENRRWSFNDYHYYQETLYWCKVSYSQCLLVKDNVKETMTSYILEICVTPNDDGTTYRCRTSTWSRDVQISVIVPPPTPPPPPAAKPTTPLKFVPRFSGMDGSVAIMIVIVIFFIIIASVAVITYKGKKLREWLFARRTPLAAVDEYANMYANSVAHYYSHHQRRMQGEGDDKETSSSSDDEFEDLPVGSDPSSRLQQEETEYVRIKPGVGRKAEAASVSKTNGDKVMIKLREDTAQSSSNNEEDGIDDDVTYTDVFIKSKDRLK